MEIQAGFIPWAGLTAIAVMGLLMAEYREHQQARAIFKTLAAMGFLAAALQSEPWNATTATWITVGLFLSVVGDISLLPSGTGRWFYVGIGAFLLAHLAYTTAFFTLGVAPMWTLIAALVLTPLATGFYRWLTPDVPPKLRTPVVAYLVVIALMVCTGLGAYGAAKQSLLIPVAVLLFALSDVAVARQRFKAPRFSNKAWGLPTYFGAQLLFALLCWQS